MTPEVQARAVRAVLHHQGGRARAPGSAWRRSTASSTRSGGSVNVYSEVGQGTSFKVYFPRARRRRSWSSTAPPPLHPAARSATQTVLVVEDAEGLRELARRLLERQGYTVLVAANADEALRLFERTAPSTCC